jgi:hypothetical protein
VLALPLLPITLKCADAGKSRTVVAATLFFLAILVSLGVALVALFRRGSNERTLLRALTIRVGLSVLFFLLLLLGWYLGILEPHGLGG